MLVQTFKVKYRKSDIVSTRFCQIEKWKIVKLSQVTCEGHVKLVTNEISRKDRGVSKGETMILEGCVDLRIRYRSEIVGTGVKKSNKGLKALRQGAGETRREQ